MIVSHMEAVAEDLAAVLDRPVTTDPRNLVPPCVLVEPPTLLADPGVLCGGLTYRGRLLVIGIPGTWASLAGLDELLAAVLGGLGEWVSATPTGYVPHNAAGEAEPAPAYEVLYDQIIEIEGV